MIVNTVLVEEVAGRDQAGGVVPQVRYGVDCGEVLELVPLPSDGGYWKPKYCVATTK